MIGFRGIQHYGPLKKTLSSHFQSVSWEKQVIQSKGHLITVCYLSLKSGPIGFSYVLDFHHPSNPRETRYVCRQDINQWKYTLYPLGIVRIYLAKCDI